MKHVLALTRALTDEKYYKEMFNTWGTEKNILWVSPQLSGKHLYKCILPYFCLPDKKADMQTVATAITSLKKFDYRKQLLDFQIDLNDDMIKWADYIIFPFTTQPLEQEIYSNIRRIKAEQNSRAMIIYSVDFNFYELSNKHPYKEIFNEPSVINDVEDNMFFSDMVLVDNTHLIDYLFDKLEKQMKSRYSGVAGFIKYIYNMPTLGDSEIVLKNLEDYNIQEIIHVKSEVTNPPAIEELIVKTEKANEQVKEENHIAPKMNNKNEVVKNKPKIKKAKVIKNGITDTSTTEQPDTARAELADSGKSDINAIEQSDSGGSEPEIKRAVGKSKGGRPKKTQAV